MVSGEIELYLSTRSGTLDMRTENFVLPTEPLVTQVQLEVVTGITLPDGSDAYNPRHSAHIANTRFEDGENQHVLTLDSSKATRLVHAFRNLHVGHETDCHDLLINFEDWVEERSGLDCGKEALLSKQSIEPGMPYAVISQIKNEMSTTARRTHSAIGAADGKLLSVLGIGSMLTLMDFNTTQHVYSGGGQGSIHRAFSPTYAEKFANRIVLSA